MKLGHFVSSTAVILVGWLGFTFVLDVPTQRYPKLDKYTLAPPLPAAPEFPATGSQLEIFQVSLSH
jgi:hypothetical protein